MELLKKVSNLLDYLQPLARPSLKLAVITTYAVSPFLYNKGPITLTNESKHPLGKSSLGVTSKRNMRRITNSNRHIYLPLKSYSTYISEKVHYLPAKDIPALKNFKSNNVKLNAAAIMIDGKPVVYVRNRNAAEQVIRNLELNFVTEDQFNKLDALKSSLMDSFSPLKGNQSYLLDIQFSKKLLIQEVEISPNSIIPIEKAVAFLLKGTSKVGKYKVQEGDILGTIANNHGLRLAELLKLNPQLTENSIIMPGQEITISEPEPYVKVINEKEVNQKEIVPNSEDVIKDPNLPKGENIIRQPRKQIVIKGSKSAPIRGEGIFSWPTVGGYISSPMGYRWGKLHKGIDIARPNNYTIKAADSGVVISASWDGSYGNKIVIDHENGFQTVYGHLSFINVSVGETVQKGFPIGIMGKTGDATGIHLHFEVYKNGILKNPLQYLRR